MVGQNNNPSFYLEEDHSESISGSFQKTEKIVVTEKRGLKKNLIVGFSFILVLFVFLMTTAASLTLLNNNQTTVSAEGSDDDNSALSDAAGDKYSGDDGFFNSLDDLNENKIPERDSFMYAIYYVLGTTYINPAEDPTIAGTDQDYEAYDLYDDKYNCNIDEKFRGGVGVAAGDPTVTGSLLAHNCDVPTLMTEFIQNIGSLFLPSGLSGAELDSAQTSALWFGFPKGAIQTLENSESGKKIPVGDDLNNSKNKYTALELFGYNLKYTVYSGEWDHIMVMSNARALSNFGLMDNIRLGFNSLISGISAGVSTAVDIFISDITSGNPLKMMGSIFHALWGGFFSAAAASVATIVDTSNTNVFATHSWFRPDFGQTVYSTSISGNSEVRALSLKERSKELELWFTYILTSVLPEVITGTPDGWPGNQLGSEAQPPTRVPAPKNQTCYAVIHTSPVDGHDNTKINLTPSDGAYVTPDKYYNPEGPSSFTQADCQTLMTAKAAELEADYNKQAEEANNSDNSDSDNDEEKEEPPHITVTISEDTEHDPSNAPDTLETWLTKAQLNPGDKIYNSLVKYKFPCLPDENFSGITEPWAMVDAVFECFDENQKQLKEDGNARENAENPDWFTEFQTGIMKDLMSSSPYMNFSSTISQYVCDSNPNGGEATPVELTRLFMQAMEPVEGFSATPNNYPDRLNYYYNPDGSVSSNCGGIVTRPPIQNGLFGNGYLPEQIDSANPPDDTRYDKFSPSFMDIVFGPNFFTGGLSSMALGVNSFVTKISNTLLNLSFSPLFEDLGLKDLIVDTIHSLGESVFGPLTIIVVMIAGIIIIFQAGVRRQYNEQFKSIIFLILTFIFGTVLYMKPETTFTFVEDFPNEIQNLAVSAIFSTNGQVDPLCSVDSGAGLNTVSKNTGSILNTSQNTVRIMSCENWNVFYFNPYVYGQWGTFYQNLYADSDSVLGATGDPVTGKLEDLGNGSYLRNSNTGLVGNGTVNMGNGTTINNWGLYQVSKYLSGNITQFDESRIPGSTDKDMYKVVDLQAGPTYYKVVGPGKIEMCKASDNPLTCPGFDDTYFSYWSGEHYFDRLYSSSAATVASMFGMVTVSIYSIALIQTIFVMTILLLILPIMFLIGMFPVGGRSKLIGYLQILVGLIIERILLAVLLALMFRILISVTQSVDSFYTYILMAIAICVLFIKYRKEIIGLFKNISNKGNEFASGFVENPREAVLNALPQSVKTGYYERKFAAKGMAQGFVGGTIASRSFSTGFQEAKGMSHLMRNRALNKERRSQGSGAFQTSNQINRAVESDLGKKLASSDKVQEAITEVESSFEGTPDEAKVKEFTAQHRKGERLTRGQSKALFKVLRAEEKAKGVRVTSRKKAEEIASNPELRGKYYDDVPWDSPMWDDPMQREELIASIKSDFENADVDNPRSVREEYEAKSEYAREITPKHGMLSEFQRRQMLKKSSSELINDLFYDEKKGWKENHPDESEGNFDQEDRDDTEDYLNDEEFDTNEESGGDEDEQWLH